MPTSTAAPVDPSRSMIRMRRMAPPLMWLWHPVPQMCGVRVAGCAAADVVSGSQRSSVSCGNALLRPWRGRLRCLSRVVVAGLGAASRSPSTPDTMSGVRGFQAARAGGLQPACRRLSLRSGRVAGTVQARLPYVMTSTFAMMNRGRAGCRRLATSLHRDATWRAMR
jgi:hypothetical protein